MKTDPRILGFFGAFWGTKKKITVWKVKISIEKWHVSWNFLALNKPNLPKPIGLFMIVAEAFKPPLKLPISSQFEKKKGGHFIRMTNMPFSKNLGDNKKKLFDFRCFNFFFFFPPYVKFWIRDDVMFLFAMSSDVKFQLRRLRTWNGNTTGWADEGAVVVGIWKADTTKTTQDILEGYFCLFNAKLQCIFTKLKMGSARIRHFRRDLSANLRSKFKSDILFILSNSILAPKTAIQESCNMRRIFCIACW